MKRHENIISHPADLPRLCADISAAGAIGLDTEFVGEQTYHPVLCLVQVALPDQLVIVDPLKTGPLDELWATLADPRATVVCPAARAETRACQLALGRTFARSFDVQIAAGLTGTDYPMSYARLVQLLLEVKLTKLETLTDWRMRPLTTRQLRYAFDDVRYLLPLHGILHEQLHRMDRLEWLVEECGRLAHVVTDEKVAEERWWRLPALGKLKPAQLAVARELFRWREGRAEELQRPVRSIMRDETLVDLARSDQVTMQDLATIRGLAKRDLGPILEVIHAARGLPPDAWPARQPASVDPPQLSMLVDLLQAVVAQLSFQMRIAPGLIATTKELRELARSVVLRQELPAGMLLGHGWRMQHLRPMLESVLHGTQGLRVANPRAQAPLEWLPGSKETKK
mgnify:CR=1 FL=1